jgi:hypothetical protein
MVELKDLAQKIQTQLNEISETLNKDVKFVVTDNSQDYESYITLTNNDIEYNYTPAILRVLSPLITSARIGVYVGYYQLEFYGYSAEKEDVEEICNYYTNNYSDLNYIIDGKQVGLSIGGFNLTSPKISPADGTADKGSRFIANILINASVSKGTAINKANELSIFIDDTYVEYEMIDMQNDKSLLNTEYATLTDERLVSDRVTITFLLPKMIYQRYSYNEISDKYEQDDNGLYLKTVYNGNDVYFLESAQRYNENEEADDNGQYILAQISGTPTYIIPYPETVEDEFGSVKINTLYAIGISAAYNSLHKIRFKLPQQDKTAYYVYKRFFLNRTKQNIPYSFSVVFELARERNPITIDGETLNVITHSYTNTGTPLSKVGPVDLVTRSNLQASIKKFTLVIEHDNSLISSALLSEIINDLDYDTYHELSVSYSGYNGAIIDKTYTVFITNGSYETGENGLITYTIEFTERNL